MFTLSALDGAWAQHITVSTASTEMTLVMGPSVGQSWNTDGGQPIQVRGADAWLGPPDSNWLFAPLSDSFHVLLTTSATGADLVRIIEDLDFGPIPDMTWYGSR
jgi:hypothetical protein